MIKRILTICAAVAAGAAGTSVALAQGYSQPPGPVYSASPAPYPPGGYVVDERRLPGAPDFDALEDDDAPNAQSSTALPPPGPVLSPDDPRYGRPDRRSAGLFRSRRTRRSDPVARRSALRPPRWTAAGDLFGPSCGSAATNLFGSRQRHAPSAGRGRRSDRCHRNGGSLRRGTDGKPLVLSALPPEEQPEVGPAQLPQNLRRQEVAFATKEPPGTLIVDTPNTYLYYVLGGGRAIRYGVRVGRDGFTWTGVQKISRKAEWPDWHPPTEMIERQPYLPRFMAGGPGNPLGARAMYLGSTVYRIHGTNQPSTIGKFVSSGCIGMLNEDVSDLFDRVKVGTRVVVLPGGAPPASTATASAQPVPAPGSAQASSAPVPGMQPTVVPPLPAPVTVR